MSVFNRPDAITGLNEQCNNAQWGCWPDYSQLEIEILFIPAPFTVFSSGGLSSAHLRCQEGTFPIFFYRCLCCFLCVYFPDALCWWVGDVFRCVSWSFALCLSLSLSLQVEHPFSFFTSGSSYPTWGASAPFTVVSGRRCAAVSLFQPTTPSAGMGRRWQTGKSVSIYCSVRLWPPRYAPADKWTLLRTLQPATWSCSHSLPF